MHYWYVCFVLLLPLTGLAQSGHDKKILDVEQRRFEAMIRKDTAALRSMLADDLVYLHSNALLEDKAEHIRAIVSGRLVYQKMVREQANVRRYGSTALVNGIVQVSGILNGTPFDVRLAYSAVYRKKGGRWRLANWQSTRMNE